MCRNQEILETKKACQQSLIEQFKATYQQLGMDSNQAKKLVLKQQADQLEEEINKLGEEIKELRLAAENNANKIYQSYSLKWQEKMPKIDYEKANKTLKDVLGKFENREGQALFLLKNSNAMGGEWCIELAKSYLQDLGTWVAPFEFGFAVHQQTNFIDFLNFLSKRINIESKNLSMPDHTQVIIDGICKSLRLGNVLMIKVDIYYLHQQDDFLKTYLANFWQPLVEAATLLNSEQPRIRIVSIVSVRGSIPKACMPKEMCCKKSNFDSKKYLELPLQKWTKDDIWNWLADHSGLANLGRTRAQMEQMARAIFDVSDGNPRDVHSELMKNMDQYVS